MPRHALDSLKLNETGRCWIGEVETASGARIELAVRGGRRDPAVALALARLAFDRIWPRVGEAPLFAAGHLLEYYNVFNAHIENGERLTDEEFAGRLELEAIWFSPKGSATIDFRHRLYRGYRGLEGGLIVVHARFDGELRKAAWVSEADTVEWRRSRRGFPADPEAR